MAIARGREAVILGRILLKGRKQKGENLYDVATQLSVDPDLLEQIEAGGAESTHRKLIEKLMLILNLRKKQLDKAFYHLNVIAPKNSKPARHTRVMNHAWFSCARYQPSSARR